MSQAYWDWLGSSSVYLTQSIWDANDAEMTSRTNRMLLTLAFCIAHSICTFGLTFFFEFLTKFNLLQRHRIQAEKRIEPKILKELWTETIVDHAVVQWLFVYYVIGRIYEASGALDAFCGPQIPSLFTHLFHIGTAIVIEDFGFYWVHRLLHQKFIYAKIHKEHHKITVNHPLAFQHAHIVEKLVCNSIPFWLPGVVLQMHGSTFLLWTVFQISESVEAHSGYELPFSPFKYSRDGDRHDYHHSHGGGPEGMKNVGNYGSWFEFWDRVCGTDTIRFRKTKKASQ